jgi:hypothetical protein
LTFSKTDSSGNTLTVDTTDGSTIAGASSVVLSYQGDAISLLAPDTGTDWVVVGGNSNTTVGTHEALTATHGATGAVVGTTNIQTFATGAKTFNSGILVATRPKITTSIDDSGGNEVIKTPATASAVNEITVTNAATATDPEVSATGGDSNINLKLTAKGTGGIYVASPIITGALPGAAGNRTTAAKLLTSMTDNTATDAITVTVPNAAHCAGIFVWASGSLGDCDSTHTQGYFIAVSRLSGATTLTTVSTAFGSAKNTGATADATTTIAVSANAGAVGATQTFTITAKVAKSTGSAANHICNVYAQIVNGKSTGITMVAA